MKCTKVVQLKWLTITATLVLVTVNLNLTSNFTQRRQHGASYFYGIKANVSMVGDLNSTETTLTFVKKSSDGYNLAKRLNQKCKRTRALRRREKVFGIYEWRSVETCIIWKIGTTAIKRFYMMKKLTRFSELINPYEIRFDKRYLPKTTVTNSQSSKRFMFVRDPYNRLISGYVDKLLAPNPVYWKIIGVPAIRVARQTPDKFSLKCGHDLKFHEYVKYVIKAMDPKYKGAKIDGHFDRMSTLCKPCSVNYNFVGKMESFAEDSLELLRHLNVSDQTIKLIELEGSKFAWMDALKDTAHQPFDADFRKDYIKCISFYDALKRSWEKMQIRGIIGGQDFPLTESETKTLTESMFIELAIKAREMSTSEERKSLKREHFLQMYSAVSKSDLEMIRTVYAEDFDFFEYSDRPDILFNTDKIR